MIAGRIAIPIALLIALGAAPQAEDARIKKKGEAYFDDFVDQDLDPGDTLRTGRDAFTLDYGEAGEVWVGPDTEIVYSSGTSLGLETGEVVVQARTGEFEIGAPGLLVIVAGVSAQVEVEGDGSRLTRLPARGPSVGEEDGLVVEAETGFLLWLEEGQTADIIFDPERGSTRVYVPEDSPEEIVIELKENHVSVLTGEWTVQELYVGENLIQIPPGCDIEIQKAVSEELPSEEAPEGRRPGDVFVAPPAVLPLPSDEPFEDAGDVLEVINVSPSQPQE